MSQSSIIVDSGEYTQSKCGYCDGIGGSVSHGMSAKVLTARDYQALIERGWRRSGTWLYKPNMKTSCCKLYTIRLRVQDFKISKEQKRVLRKFERYLAGEDLSTHKEGGEADMETETQQPKRPRPSPEAPPASASSSRLSSLTSALSTAVSDALSALTARGSLPSSSSVPPRPPVQYLPREVAAKQKLPEDVALSSPAVNQYLGWARKQLGAGAAALPSPPALLTDLTAELNQGGRLPDGVTVSAGDKGFLNFHVPDPALRAELLQDHKSQHTPPTSPRPSAPKSAPPPSTSSAAPLKPRIFEFRNKPAEFDKEEFELYKRYQMAVHHDPPGKLNERGYTNFLVETPIPLVTKQSDPSAPPCGYGSFHQQYRIDGKLIAVGVVDILPHGLSSKYCFYDPDLPFLSLGKLVALKEIEWIAEQRATAGPQFEMYFMGYYIHTCPKMRYKGEYRPSELLCPETFTWWPLADALPLVETGQYNNLHKALSKDSAAPPVYYSDSVVQADQALQTRILLGRSVLPLSILAGKIEDEAVEEIVDSVSSWRKVCGEETASRIVYALQM